MLIVVSYGVRRLVFVLSLVAFAFVVVVVVVVHHRIVSYRISSLSLIPCLVVDSRIL